MNIKYNFSVEINFTDTYKKYKNEHIAILESMCLQQMYPDILCKIQEEDGFAGRLQMSYIGFSPEIGGLGYYCDINKIENELSKSEYDNEFKGKIKSLMEFWKTENTLYKVRVAYSEHVAKALPDDDWMTGYRAAFPLYRMGGSYLDYEKLLQNGIPGLKRVLTQRKTLATEQRADIELFEAMERALELLSKCCIYYSDMAMELYSVEQGPVRKQELLEMSASLKKIAFEKPETLREAIQLSWLYSIVSGSMNYGRMDVYLGDFLANDVETGVLSIAEAQELINSYWRLIVARKSTWNGRVVLGGKGRRNEKNADQFALFAMEATRVVEEIEPQLTLRFYQGMNAKLMEKALAVIGEGRTYPMLYNDDVNVAAVSKAFKIGGEEAKQYVPFGCGEYVIDHKSFGTPNGVINILKALEITLRNGRDAITGELIGLETGDFKDFITFEQLFDAYKKQVEYLVDSLAEQEEIEYSVVGKTAPFLYLSMLYDNCIVRGKGIFSGGVKYLGGTLESYGNTNTADSLAAIKDIIYVKRLLTPEQLINALDTDFEGFVKERKALQGAPKYGNDNSAADEMAVRVHEHVCNTARNQINKVKLHSYLIVVINNSANTILGKQTSASADGRLKGNPMANANAPSGGNDKKGLTAFLNSLVKLTPEIHAGMVQNMKFSPELFKNSGIVVKSVLQTYFEKGGTQAMITVVNKDDLENAMIEPEKYQHIFVRVGGFSARFVELVRDIQLEILSRTQY
ncbi:MAG TPA: pyruvate formate lyase family protein [Ruminiclostridium sp.]